MCAVHKRTLTVLPSEKAPARRKRPWQFLDFVFLGRRRRPYIVFRFRFLYGFMFVYIYVTKWRRSGYLEFTKLLLALSSFSKPFDQMRSIQEHYFIILSQRQACAGRFREETAGKRRGPVTKWPPPVRNRLCYHFFLYRTNESCSRIVSRRLMLLRSLNKSYLWVTAPNATEAERPFYERSRILCT